MLRKGFALLTCLLALSSHVTAQLPYNPVQLIASPDRSKVYQFSPQASQASFSYFDISNQISTSSAPTAVHQPIPFDTAGRSYIPIADDAGITVLVGYCQGANKEAALWRFTFNKDGRTGTWKAVNLGSSDNTLASNYLSAGFTYSANGSTADISLYVFGGMCPSEKVNTTSWTSQATYSNTMFSVSAGVSQSSQLSITGTRSPPIAEAGLTITPLSPVSTKSVAGKTSQQQNFVLLGGHTQTAFINMSQVALFSLPESSWAFIGVNQPSGLSGELARRASNVVEPRSGHTAVLSDDGSKIIVFGGWVGGVSNPATPQLAILQLGQGYGGASNWEWSIPKQTDNPISSGQGVYGHGAVMLPGNVMMISGGTNIGASKRKRNIQGYMFYHVDTGAWSSTYQNSTLSTGGLDSAQKAGLGAGLGLGLTAMIAILIVWLLYRRKQREKRAERERYLRELAFGSERHQSSSRVGSVTNARVRNPEMRSASWGSRQEQEIENNGLQFPWHDQRNQSDRWHEEDNEERVARTGTEVPSPTRGLRKSLSLRGPAVYGKNFTAPMTGPGSVFRIDEAEEEGSIRSYQAKTPAGSRMSDPFKDPPELELASAAEERKREVKGWVEDWQEAAVSMSISRNPSRARSPSNLSHQQSSSDSSSYRTGRESPEKSDRTGSNLSERSEFSLQKSTGGMSRQISQRSVSAGYALFSGASAALGRLGGANRETALERAASKRSLSLQTSLPRRTASGTQRPYSGESNSLLQHYSPTKSVADDSPIKDYKNYSRASSFTSQQRKTGILGSFKRVLTGTSHVDVQAQVEHFEEKSEESVTPRQEPEMSETMTGPVFWRGKRGAKDWDDGGQPSSPAKRRSTIDATSSMDDYDGEEWDVETAVQQRVVQVMFTVPKEKLRVVNADALSLISRSDIDEKEQQAELRRMDSVREGDDDSGEAEEEMAKQKEAVR